MSGDARPPDGSDGVLSPGTPGKEAEAREQGKWIQGQIPGGPFGQEIPINPPDYLPPYSRDLVAERAAAAQMAAQAAKQVADDAARVPADMEIALLRQRVTTLENDVAWLRDAILRLLGPRTA